MIRKQILILSIVALLPYILQATITTSYPESITLRQINSAEKERVRLCQGHKKYDRQPTGFYVEAGKTIEINVEILTAADRNTMPVLTVGTMGFNVSGRNTGTQFPLTAGLNTITGHPGGLIWLSFVQDGKNEPTGNAKITFTANSQQVRAPHYVFGTTTDEEFTEMMNTYQTPDVLYSSDYIAVVATREAAQEFSIPEKKAEWMEAIHTLLAKEDEIGGLDNNDPNPLHNRLKAGEVRFLLTENTSASPHANSVGYTGYPNGSRRRYLTKLGTTNNNSWMLGHELGHQHQQPAYLINKATESTVNIYSYVVERNIQGSAYNRTSAARWKGAQDTYLKLPVAERIYDMDDTQLEGITGFNRDELRFMVWEQLFLIFGDPFYQILHRVVREEKAFGGDADERRDYLIWKASQVSGYDLTGFFDQWGIRVTNEALNAKRQARMNRALADGSIIPLPVDAGEAILTTGQNLPAWTPLALRGITESAPEINPFDRSGWTITTSINGPADATVGGDDPWYIIDDNRNTAFSFVKPGITYGGIAAPADYIPSFTIDMQTVREFNYASYAHRSYNNTSELIRARQISIYGSSDNSDDRRYTPIVEHYAIDPIKNVNELIVDFAPVSYRYLKVVIEDWNRESGSTIQIEEFNAGTRTQASLKPVENQLQASIYPNPVKAGQPFYVRAAAGLSGAIVNIYSISGAKHSERKINATFVEQRIDDKGIYILEVKNDAERQVMKIVVN
jgi:hypothetical protein